MSVEFMDFDRGQDVIVRGKRIPMLTARLGDAGKVFLVFDHRIGLQLEASNYEQVIDFVATVMENVMDPECGRTFNTMVELSAVESEDA